MTTTEQEVRGLPTPPPISQKRAAELVQEQRRQMKIDVERRRSAAMQSPVAPVVPGIGAVFSSIGATVANQLASLRGLFRF